jgi:adenylate kinase family enzyme
MNKILIIGEAGRGKTTLAKTVSETLDLPHHSTDDLFWETKYSVPKERALALRLAEELYEKEKWIMEGTTQWLIEPGLEHADTILFLNFKTIFHQWFFIVKRFCFEKNNKESFKSLFQLLRHVFYKKYKLSYKKDSVTHRELLKPYWSKVIELSSFKEISEFCGNL